MKLLDKLFKRLKTEKIEENTQEERPFNEGLPIKIKRETFKERHPDGLTLDELKEIDFKKFGQY